jgi:tetratricopeptide (TPR) repeat protein
MLRFARMLAVITLVSVGGCDRDGASHTLSPADPRTQTARAEAFAGEFAYQEAKRYIQASDLRSAVTALQRAIAQNPDLTEAYYQLGAAKTNLAIEEVRRDERAAIELFREGVEAKKEARRLMNQNKYYIWDERQRAQARVDLREALRDVDAVLADEPSLIAALKTYGG